MTNDADLPEEKPDSESPAKGGDAPPETREPSLIVAVIPVAFLIALLAVTIVHLKQTAHIPLLLATCVAGLLGWSQGVRWPTLLDGITRGITVALPACLILMVIGTLIGTWILGGIVPTLIVYGLEIVSPTYFLVTSCLVCSVVSLATGSSWSTAGTVGVALVGIGGTLGIPAGMTAGAIVSGAYFGDKMSPLSDTTNLAPAVAGADLFDHIRHMAWTTGPSLLIGLALFLLFGLQVGRGSADAEAIAQMSGVIHKHFTVHWALLLPPVAVIGLVVARVPALPALVVGALLGGICAAEAQGASLGAVMGAAQKGYAAQTGVKVIDSLLTRGGMENMMPTVALIMCALSFGGIMECTGMLQSLARGILYGVKRTGSLVVRTLLTCIGMNVLAADQYMAIVIPGRMYRDAFAARGLHPKNLSRCLEDAGTMTSALVPWNTCGAFMSSTLGVSPLVYLPYAVVNLLNPAVSTFYGFTGLTMAPAPSPAEPPEDALETG